MAANITVLSETSFDEEVKGSDLPVVVDFWAEWCGPCKLIAPVLAELATEQEGKLRVAKLNVDEAPGVGRRYDIMSIPTLLVFKDGVEKKRIVGARGKRQLLADLEEFLT